MQCQLRHTQFLQLLALPSPSVEDRTSKKDIPPTDRLYHAMFLATPPFGYSCSHSSQSLFTSSSASATGVKRLNASGANTPLSVSPAGITYTAKSNGYIMQPILNTVGVRARLR